MAFRKGERRQWVCSKRKEWNCSWVHSQCFSENLINLAQSGRDLHSAIENIAEFLNIACQSNWKNYSQCYCFPSKIYFQLWDWDGVFRIDLQSRSKIFLKHAQLLSYDSGRTRKQVHRKHCQRGWTFIFLVCAVYRFLLFENDETWSWNLRTLIHHDYY